jgi:protein-disulfide isomerase
MSEHKKSFFDSFSPKGSFFFGLSGGIAVVIVLLAVWVIVSGGLPGVSDSRSKSGSVAVAPSPVPNGAAAPAPPAGDLAPVTEDDHIRGDYDAPITIVEYSDFECPFCSRFHPTLLQVMDEYGEDVRWIYRHFPLASIHPQATPAAEASECAAAQGGNDAFWAYSDRLFDNQTSLGRSFYVELAGDIGLSTGEFESCLDEGRFAQKVQDQYQSGLSAGVRGTPGTYINGQSIPGAVPYEQVKAVIDSLL